jgi:transposase
VTISAIASPSEETEVTEKAKRRTFTTEYKRRIVKEAESCKKSGEVGALLRREGLYSSMLSGWRLQRDRGELAPGAATKKRGPQVSPADPRDKKIIEQAREIAKLTARAERAEAIAEIQTKVAALLGRPFPNEES